MIIGNLITGIKQWWNICITQSKKKTQRMDNYDEDKKKTSIYTCIYIAVIMMDL